MKSNPTRSVGAPPKSYKTKQIALRVPAQFHSELCGIVRKKLSALKKKHNLK